MSSPTNLKPDPEPQIPEPANINAPNEFDVDAEMEDQPPADASGTVNNNVSSGTMEHDLGSTQQQSEVEGSGATASLPQQNRKDVTLREFMSKMDDYAPIIPDAVTAHYLTLAGLPPPSPHDPTGVTTNTTPLPLARLLALATQKFVADIAADAYQYSRIRASNTASGNNPLGAVGALPGQTAAAVGGVGGVAAGGGGKAGQGAAALGVQRSGYGGGGQGGSGQGRTVLTMEDLGMAVQEYGVSVKRGEFYR